MERSAFRIILDPLTATTEGWQRKQDKHWNAISSSSTQRNTAFQGNEIFLKELGKDDIAYPQSYWQESLTSPGVPRSPVL